MVSRTVQSFGSSPRRTVADAAMLAIFFMILLLGGAGLDYPIFAGLVQTGAVLLLLLSVLSQGQGLADRERLPWPVWTIIAAFLLFFAVQLLPLPLDIWRGLPGRALATGMVDASGIDPAWPSLSLDPVRTAGALPGLLPGLALLVVGYRARAPLRKDLVATLLLFAVLTTILGALQRVGSGVSEFFPYGHRLQDAPGLFVNRNHQATLLLVAIPLLAHFIAGNQRLVRAGPAAKSVAAWGGIVLFAAGIVATTSRAGLLLLPLAVLSAWLILRERQLGLKTVIATLAPLSLVIAIGSLSPSVQTVLDRFTREEALRPLYWANTARAAWSYWPAGSGIGTFTSVYPASEPLEQLDIAYVNNAHNDYLETWLEGGAAAALLLAMLVVVIGIGVYRRFRDRNERPSRNAGIAALTGLALIALHSLVDYPLRMMSLMAVAGLLLAILLRQPTLLRSETQGNDSTVAQNMKRESWTIRAANWGGALLLAVLLVPIWAIALSQHDLAGKRPQQALTFNPWSTGALIDAGYESFARKAPGEAGALARRALSIAPLDARAAALLSVSLGQQGDVARSRQLLTAAGRLGWREPHIQYMLTQAAADRQDDAETVLHADALLRTGNYVTALRPFLRQLEPFPNANAALVKALARQPAWRQDYLINIADLPENAIDAHATLLDGLAKTKAPPNDDEISAFVTYLVARQQFDAAIRYARHFGMASFGTNLLDPGATRWLDASDRQLDPFAWRSGNALGVVVEPDPSGTLSIRSGRATVGTVIRRLVIAKGGILTLKGLMRETALGSFQLFKWTLRCQGSDELVVPSAVRILTRRPGGTAFEIAFDVPATNCPAQSLQLNIDSSTGGAADIILLRLEAAYP